MKNFAYFYFMKNEKDDEIRQIAKSHSGYWHDRNLEDYKGGPFADRSGGLIIFKAMSIEKAKQLIDNDPFVENGLLEQKWIKEWEVLE